MTTQFLIDQQTLQDLQLRDRTGRNLLDFYDQAITEGGQEFLRYIFYTPLTDKDAIMDRQTKIHRLAPVVQEEFPFFRVILKDLEKYVNASHSGRMASLTFLDFIGVRSPIYYYRKRSIIEACEFLINSVHFYKKVNAVKVYPDMEEMIALSEECLRKFFKNKTPDADKLRVNIFNIEYYDRLIRYDLAANMRKIIRFFYEIDAYLAVAKVAHQHEFCYPELFQKNETGKINMQGVYHIFHRKPVKNDLTIYQNKKLWFLTGANMAGKSSIIKSIATALYLTHIGFPVPADGLQTDILDGLFTSINLQDNLELGYSHFYVEAIRLKEIIDQLRPDSNALIILDELFKGTNHSDASHAILEVMDKLAKLDGPYVIVSSHITELSEKLKDSPLVDFRKMVIDNDENGMPIFTYKITEGIAEEKLGMWLLKNSGVFESIESLRKEG